MRGRGMIKIEKTSRYGNGEGKEERITIYLPEGTREMNESKTM